MVRWPAASASVEVQRGGRASRRRVPVHDAVLAHDVRVVLGGGPDQVSELEVHKVRSHRARVVRETVILSVTV